MPCTFFASRFVGRLKFLPGWQLPEGIIFQNIIIIQCPEAKDNNYFGMFIYFAGGSAPAGRDFSLVDWEWQFYSDPADRTNSSGPISSAASVVIFM
jgi:hypothetical protein